MKIFKEKTILCDIDATVTDVFNNENDYVETVFEYISKCIADKTGITKAEARTQLNTYTSSTHIWWDYSDFIVDFNLDALTIWADLKRINTAFFHAYDDAIDMIHYLHSIHKNLYIVSNNPVTGCLMKLEIAGLADLSGSIYFKRIFGTNITRGMKSQTATWKRVIANLGVKPENIITIGDNFEEDYQTPQSMGIGHTIIVNRNGEKDISPQDDYVSVNSLRHVTELIK